MVMKIIFFVNNALAPEELFHVNNTTSFLRTAPSHRQFLSVQTDVDRMRFSSRNVYRFVGVYVPVGSQIQLLDPGIFERISVICQHNNRLMAMYRVF